MHAVTLARRLDAGPTDETVLHPVPVNALWRVMGATTFTLFGLCVLACGDESGDHHGGGAIGPSTNATCPTPQTLTYQSFGQDFMGRYCLGCHSRSLTGAARKGAPDDHNFDTIDEVRGLREHIDQKSAAGPAATNTDMPRSDPRPTLDERKKLGEWLACGAP